MERLLLAFLFIVLPMILNAIEQKKKRQARQQKREDRPQTPRRDGDFTLEEWIESMQRKASERAGTPSAPEAPPEPQASPKPVVVAAPTPPPPAPSQKRTSARRSDAPETPAAPQREAPQRRARPQRRDSAPLTAAERARARSKERAAEREIEAARVSEDGDRGASRDSARRAVRAKTATRERDRKENLSARKSGGGSGLDFGGRDDLRRAIVLREVFGPPRGLEDLD